MVTTILWITIIHLQQKTSLSHVRICVKAMMVMLRKVRVFWNLIKIKSLKGLHSLSMPTQNHCFKKLMHEIKISKHRTCGYSIFTHFLLDSSKSKRDFYRSAN